MSDNIGKEIGIRIRERREALGMKQEDLAMMIPATRQCISKYESRGINDIAMLQKIATALKCNIVSLLTGNNESEIKVILGNLLDFLVENGGYIAVSVLLKHGITIEEIQKLVNDGVCAREQFTDFYDVENDVLFITQKGVESLDTDISDKVKTHEQLLEGKMSYQEVINSRALEKRIRNITFCESYRIDYLQYLHKTYEKENCGTDRVFSPYNKALPTLPGKNCYFDINFRMILELSNAKIEEIYAQYLYPEDDGEEEKNGFFESVEFQELPMEFHMQDETDGYEKELMAFFEMDALGVELPEESYKDEITKDFQNMFNEKLDKYNKRIEENEKFLAGEYGDKLESAIKSHGNYNFPYWFSKEEIERFLCQNYKKADSDEERKLDAILKQLNEDYPETLDYYGFSFAWEIQGLAKRVRDTYGIEVEEDYFS